jgi:hypothetical protein
MRSAAASVPKVKTFWKASYVMTKIFLKYYKIRKHTNPPRDFAVGYNSSRS